MVLEEEDVTKNGWDSSDTETAIVLSFVFAVLCIGFLVFYCCCLENILKNRESKVHIETPPHKKEENKS
jgi:hypothetical protein